MPGSASILRFPVWKHPFRSDPDSGLIYYLELSDDLLSSIWSSSGYSIPGTNAGAGEFRYITNRISAADFTNLFIRRIIEEE
jgi:hypothetical protein